MNNQTRGKQNHLAGIGLMLLGCFFYTASSVFVRFASQTTTTHHAAPLMLIIFFRFAVAALVLLAFSCVKPAIWKTSHRTTHIIRGLCGLFAIACFYYAINLLPLAIATLFASCSPLFVPLVLRVTRGIRILPQLYWGFVIGIIGVMMILHPNSHGIKVVSLIALLSAVFRAVSFSLIRVLGKDDLSATTMLHYFCLGTIVAGVFVIITQPDFSHLPWLDMLAVGVFGAIYQGLVVTATRLAPARALAPIVYINVVLAAIAEWFIWGQTLSWLAISGIVTVFVGAMVSIYFSNKLLH